MAFEITMPSRCYPGMLEHGGRVLSLSAGVQSTVIAHMVLSGDLPPVDVAIFADTGDERPETMEHLEGLERSCHNAFPVIRVSAGDMVAGLRAQARGEQKTGAAATPPFWVRGRDGRAAPLPGSAWRCHRHDGGSDNRRIRPLEARRASLGQALVPPD